MAKLKLKIERARLINLSTKKMGFRARVVTNGKASYEEIVTIACHNTSLHKAEAKTALELCMETVAEMLKQGYIVDLGPVGRLYPSCTGKWAEKAEDLQLDSITPSIYFRPAKEISAAVKEAKLQWTKASDDNAAQGLPSPTQEDA